MHSTPTWLRWQPIRFSAWLMAYLACLLIFVEFVPALVIWHASTETFVQSLARRQILGVWNPFETRWRLVGFVFNVWLVWFTYFSGNKRVSDSDKFVVFLMICGSVVGAILTLVRHLPVYWHRIGLVFGI